MAPLYGSGGGAAIAWPLVYIADPASLVIAPGITADIATVSHVDVRTGVTGQLLTVEGSPVSYTHLRAHET